MKRKTKYTNLTIKNKNTGEVIFGSSVKEAAEKAGLKQASLANLITVNKDGRSLHGWMLVTVDRAKSR